MEHILEIPAVTAEQLATFRDNHFSPQQNTAFTTSFSPQNFGTREHQSWEEEEEEKLGYYPDGAKRTLTDEQITMFRFSEVRGLLRSKQRAEKEANDKDQKADGEAAIGDFSALMTTEERADRQRDRLEAALWAAHLDGHGQAAQADQQTSGRKFLWPSITKEPEVDSAL